MVFHFRKIFGSCFRSSNITVGDDPSANSTFDPRSINTELATGNSLTPDEKRIGNSLGEDKPEKAVSQPADETSDRTIEESIPGIPVLDTTGNSTPDEDKSEAARGNKKRKSRKSSCCCFSWRRNRSPSPNADVRDDQPAASTSDQRSSTIGEEAAGSPTPDERPISSNSEVKVPGTTDPKSMSKGDLEAESFKDEIFIGRSTDEINFDSNIVIQPQPSPKLIKPAYPKGVCWEIPIETLTGGDNLERENNDSEPKTLVPILKNRQFVCDDFWEPESNPTPDSEEVEPPPDYHRDRTILFDELVRFARIPALDIYGDPVFEPETKGFQVSYAQLRHGPSPYDGVPEQRKNAVKKRVRPLGNSDFKVDVPPLAVDLNVPPLEVDVPQGEVNVPQLEVNREEDSEMQVSKSRPGFRSQFQNLFHDRTNWEDDLNNTSSGVVNQTIPPDHQQPIVPSELIDPGPESSEPSVIPVIKDENVEIHPVTSEAEDRRAIEDVGTSRRPRRTLSMGDLLELYGSDDAPF